LVNTIHISSKYHTTKQHPVFGGAQDQVKSFVMYMSWGKFIHMIFWFQSFSLAKLLWGQIGIVVLNQYACWVTDQFLKFNYFPQFPNSESFLQYACKDMIKKHCNVIDKITGSLIVLSPSFSITNYKIHNN
jgi:hypothetical protein